MILIVGFAAAATTVLVSSLPGGVGGWDFAQALPLGMMVVLLAARLAVSTRPLGPMARQFAMILAAGVVLVVGYSYRGDLGRVADDILGRAVPGRGTQIAPGILRLTADDNGQFPIDATVNGVTVHFLMDTGASGIALSRRDAGRLGLDPNDLRFTGMFSTANGMVRAAPVTLDSIKIGPLGATDVPAWVNEGDLDQSLLGMSYLSTLGRIEIRGDTLILER